MNNSLLVLLETLESSQRFSFGFPFYFHSVCKGFLRMFPENSQGFSKQFPLDLLSIPLFHYRVRTPQAVAGGPTCPYPLHATSTAFQRKSRGIPCNAKGLEEDLRRKPTRSPLVFRCLCPVVVCLWRGVGRGRWCLRRLLAGSAP